MERAAIITIGGLIAIAIVCLFSSLCAGCNHAEPRGNGDILPPLIDTNDFSSFEPNTNA